ncbi:class I SAM-dependent methyltransferase [Actinomadura rudentiformis]|uniref:Class I SAM-dependent methyltransferase n=1 Tax=Actinomadura rudentiformis TaxID=359158 RepID=A0A6H9YC31_9ACTN|nr:class I SAM-dependent methyltransferase [Actinomadura rudentiformis]KAB2340994.1 class I SAM-dependent methyltransferase [Actinomadura rudentiformis]
MKTARRPCKVHTAFTPVQATLYRTLAGRALDSRARRPILGDPTAVDTVRKIDFDFSRLKIGSALVTRVAVQTRYLDKAVRGFVTAHPDAVVVDLGAGLDARIFRVIPPSSVAWFDVDFPAVAAARRRVLPEHPQARQIGTCLTDPGWLDQIPDDRPAMVVADGLLPFLTQGEIQALVNRLTGHFRAGELAFNGDHPSVAGLARYLPAMKKTAALMRSAPFADPREPESWAPRMRLIQETSLAHVPEVALFPPAIRLGARIAGRSSTLSRSVRVLRYRF